MGTRKLWVMVVVTGMALSLLQAIGPVLAGHGSNGSGEGAGIVVDLNRVSYARGEPVLGKLAIHNGQSDPLVLSSLDYVSGIYYLGNNSLNIDPEPVIHSLAVADLTARLTIEPGSTAQLLNTTQLWDQQTENGSQASRGIYLYIIRTIDTSQEIEGYAAFTIGPTSIEGVPVDEIAGQLQDSSVEPFRGGPSAQSTGGSAGYGFMYPRWYSVPQTWFYNDADEPNLLGVLTAIQNGFDTWENDGGTYFDLTHGGQTTARAHSQDDTYTVDWRHNYLPTNVQASVQCWVYSSDTNRLYECDEVLNADLTWSTSGNAGAYDVQNIATHEAGHWIQLKDLYNPSHNSYKSWMGDNNEDMTMYGVTATGETSKRSLEWGDWSGVRYAYARTPTAASSIGDQTDGGGSKIGDVDGSGSPDRLVSWVDDPSGGNTIYYRIGWSLSASTGEPSSSSLTKTAFSGVGDSTAGLGSALGTAIDGDGNQELVLAWIDDPSGSNTIYYRVGWDLDSFGNPSFWSTTKTVATIGHETQGAGTCLTNLDSNADPELVVTWIDNPSGANSLLYKIGYNLDSNGNAASWSSTITQGSVGDENQGAGVTCTDLDENGATDLVFGFVDNPSGDNRMYYRIGFNPGSDGSTSDWREREAPGANDGIGFETQGMGLGSGEVDNEGIDEMTFTFVDNPSGGNSVHYRDEWNGRYMSHN